MKSSPIIVQYKKSTGKVTHIDKSGKKTSIRGLPSQASLKAIKKRIKALGLEI